VKNLQLVAASISGLVLTLVIGGCATSVPLTPVKSTDDFQTKVLDNQRPVVMLFYKQGCAPCAALQPTLKELAYEYKGRVVFAEYPLMSFVFIPNNAELRDRYEVAIYPTVVLFMNGLEKHRWVAEFGKAAYRKVLDEAIASPTTKLSTSTGKS